MMEFLCTSASKNSHLFCRPWARKNRVTCGPDALCGLFLLIMAGVHARTPVSRAMQDPLGYNGAAEGFIFLSACLAGMVYGKTYRQADWATMSRRKISHPRPRRFAVLQKSDHEYASGSDFTSQ